MNRILIYDDIRKSAEELKKILSETENTDCIDISDNYYTTLDLLKKNKYSVIFMDIELDNGKNGINFAEKLQHEGGGFELVYITGHTKYYEKIFLTKPSAFIQKPFNSASVRFALDLLRKKKNFQNSFLIIEVTKNHSEKILLENIAYIEHANRCLKFSDSKNAVLYSFYGRKISEIENILPDNFVRCHQSFIVNMNFISGIQRFCFNMNLSGKQFSIPISQMRFKETKIAYMNYISSIV